MKKQPVKIKEAESSERIKGFREVVLGYSEEEAIEEAKRCLQCKNPTCIAGCPVAIDIKRFILQVAEKDYKEAYFTIRKKNDFPSICGRVCPAEYQCRKTCVFTKKDSPFASEKAINIHFLERFVGDFGVKHDLAIPIETNARLSGTRVAVVGSGPAGLCCAGELARQGLKVVIFEGLHRPGGVLRYGIPSFRLPRDVLDFEINYLERLGVENAPNMIIGKTKSLDELFAEGFSAVFLGLGAGAPSFLGVPGENLCNIYSANEFLTRVNLMGAYRFPEYHTPVNIGKDIIVIGGGNTAMDAARVALRLQNINNIKPNVTVYYRRTEKEMPARRLEIEHAREEGIRFEFLVAPSGFTGKNDGYVDKIRCLRCELGEPDFSGRRRPVPIKGSEFEKTCDLAIIAVGLNANRILTGVTPGLKLDKYGDIIVNPATMETSIKGVYAGGDIVGGEGTVIEAMGMAKKASAAIIEYLSKSR
ncbi:MAG: glutamate synthase (NADPH), homotetrameric [Omnitrophica bacterium RBG_13_46_9]|nr:MAG: glutamate synthase (NADPH), homotetrameric [Omnitrophica bacterium RBG_13_46_9]